MKKTTIKSAGFTLVELAIVMIAIGIVSVAVLKGQEYVSNARIKTTIAQMQSYQSAFNTFRDTYRFLPGDMPAARTVLAGCDAAANCNNGDRNNQVGITVNLLHVDPYDDSPINLENTQFWKHLAMADLVSGVVPNTNVIAWGSSHPSAGLGGGYRVTWSDIRTSTVLYTTNDMLFIRLVSQPTGAGRLGAGLNTVTPLQGQIIDRTIDDGNGNSGSVLVSSAAGSGTCRQGGLPAGQDGVYNTNISRKDCILMFGIYAPP